MDESLLDIDKEYKKKNTPIVAPGLSAVKTNECGRAETNTCIDMYWVNGWFFGGVG